MAVEGWAVRMSYSQIPDQQTSHATQGQNMLQLDHILVDDT